MSEAGNPGEKSDAVGWAGLLARWTAVAKASVALPRDGEGGRWRRSVAPAIGLQAVAAALEHIETIPPIDRAGACDTAEVLIERHEEELERVWGEGGAPEALGEMVQEAREALTVARGRMG